jgi:hypothetical protein
LLILLPFCNLVPTDVLLRQVPEEEEDEEEDDRKKENDEDDDETEDGYPTIRK